MLSDIEIAQSAKIKPITEVAEQAGIDPDKLELYGKYKAKLPLDYIQNLPERPDAKLILVTAMNPTPAGEGKTTVSIGLAQGLKLVGKNPILALSVGLVEVAATEEQHRVRILRFDVAKLLHHRCHFTLFSHIIVSQ